MKKIGYILAGLIGLAACADDEGNYNYHEINEMTVRGFGDTDTVYNLLYMVDTLKIEPTLDCTLDKEPDDENYTFRWELTNRQELGVTQIVSRERKLALPIEMTPGNYTITLRVKDKSTGLAKTIDYPMQVGLTYSKGLYVLCDREDGSVQLDMIAMIESRQDTLILEDMLADTDIPPLKHGIEVLHTGSNDNEENVRLWVMTETGSYYLNSKTMQGDASNTIWKMMYSSIPMDKESVYPVEGYPKICMGSQSGTKSGYVRGFRLNNGAFVFTQHMLVELYNNPISVYRTTPTQLINAFPGCLYSARYLRRVILFDMDSQSFIGAQSPEYETYMTTMINPGFMAFPYNNKSYNRTCIHMENTRNPQYQDKGTSYALMKNTVNGDLFIYGFDAYNNITSSAKAFWRIDMDLARNIDKATKFLFSSDRLVLYYLVDNKVYAYSFNTGNEKCEVVANFRDSEVTWWDVDKWTEKSYDYIWVATYNPATGGVISKYKEPDDQNMMAWEKTDTEWGGFHRIKSVCWRNCNY